MSVDVSNSGLSSFFAIAALTISSFLFSQESIHFSHITTDDGLSQSDINTIYQDKLGFMWFGTHDGLNKYDGYRFTVYKPDSKKKGSISSNLIFTITGDNENNLWVGTTGNGLNFYNHSTESFVQYKNSKDNDSSLSNDHVTKVFLDSKNRLWVGTNNGLNMLDLEITQDSIRFQRFNPEKDPFMIGWDGNSIFDIYEDTNNQIWVGSHGGLYKLARDENGRLYFQLVNALLGLPNLNVRSIAEDKTGKMIIGTEKGLYYQKNNNQEVLAHKISDGYFNAIQVDNNNHIWAGANDGLYYFGNHDEEGIPQLSGQYNYNTQSEYSLSKNIVKSIFIDKTGIIWIGTNGGGINKFDPNRKQFGHFRKNPNPNSLSYDKIRAIFEDSNGYLWIGTEGGGLNMLRKEYDNGKYDNFEVFDNITKPFAIAEIIEANRKKLIIGAEGETGLFELDITNPNQIEADKIKSVEGIDKSVFAIYADSNQNLWIGTYGGGIHRWMKDNDMEGGYLKDNLVHNPSESHSISDNIIRSIIEDKKGNIWFATANGLSKLTKEEKFKNQPRFEVFRNDPVNDRSISHNYILSIYESQKGDLWIGTFGGGLNKLVLSKDGKIDGFVSYSEAEGLPNDVIKGVLEDESGNLWISTNQGLSKFDPQGVVFKNFNFNDGLQSNEFQELACLKRKNGEMLFGGVNGFNAFYPSSIVDNSFTPETVITDFLISNEPIRIGEEIHGRVLLNQGIGETDQLNLKYSENSFSFEFAALHFASSTNNHFAYMLSGFDEEWIQTTSSKRFATYTNLGPGLYTLKVKASNNDGLWDPTPAQIKIKVIPPLWRTDVAYGFYGLLALGLLWLFWRYTFIRTTKKHQLELESIEKKKSEEMQRVKLEFFTNISHEFRTPLTLIKGPLEYLQEKNGELDTSIVQEQYSIMKKNTDYLLRLVNQLLDFRKINQGKMHLVVRKTDIVAFVKEVTEPFQFMALRRNIALNIIANEATLISYFDHEALEKIMNNLLSNAFKFTPENGKITITISKEKQNAQDTVAIIVKDSGNGIPEERINEIFKRFYAAGNGVHMNPEGIGIGLSFTKSLVELHQGTIDLTSAPGQGTEFVVSLPIHKEAYSKIKEITIKEITDSDFLVRSSETESFAIGINDEIEDETLSNSRSKHPVLLIIDDNKDIRTFIKRSLQDEFTIYEAEDGSVGLNIANRIIPNIVLCDVLMPVMDGMEFCKALKSQKETSHIPVLLLTAKSSEESEKEGLKLGADDYLTKPFNMEVLKLKLTNIISQRATLRKRFNRNIAINPSEITVTSSDEKFLNSAMEIVEKHMMNTDFNVEMMVKEMGLSRSNLYLKFKELTGLSSSGFIRNVRLKRAVQLFETSDLSVKEIMYMTGFNTASYFSKCFKKQFGVIPSEYVKHRKTVDTPSDSN